MVRTMEPIGSRRLLTRERRLHQAVSVITLAAAGLLSSIGIGLHGWFGCSHGCVAQRVVATQGTEEQPRSVIESSGRCELCDLLAQYRFVRVQTPEAVHPSPCVMETPRADASPWVGSILRWPSPRGPPC